MNLYSDKDSEYVTHDPHVYQFLWGGTPMGDNKLVKGKETWRLLKNVEGTEDRIQKKILREKHTSNVERTERSLQRQRT